MFTTRKQAAIVAAQAQAIGRTQGAHVCVLAEPKVDKCVGMDSAFAVAVVRVTPGGSTRTVCATADEAIRAAHGA